MSNHNNFSLLITIGFIGTFMLVTFGMAANRGPMQSRASTPSRHVTPRHLEFLARDFYDR